MDSPQFPDPDVNVETSAPIYRAAKPSDAPAIAAIWNPLIAETTVTFTTEAKTPEGIVADMAARGAGFQVVEVQGVLLGFATFFAFRGGPGYALTKEHSIHMAAQARGRGLGRGLMAQLEKAAQAEGVHSMWAGISGENTAGQAFHRAIGYTEVARLPEVGRKFDRWHDLILMQKRLTFDDKVHKAL